MDLLPRACGGGASRVRFIRVDPWFNLRGSGLGPGGCRRTGHRQPNRRTRYRRLGSVGGGLHHGPERFNLEPVVDVNHETHEVHENTARQCKWPLSDDLTHRVHDRHSNRRASFRVILCISWFQLFFSSSKKLISTTDDTDRHR